MADFPLPYRTADNQYPRLLYICVAQGNLMFAPQFFKQQNSALFFAHYQTTNCLLYI